MRKEMERFVKDNFFDRRNSTNLSLARSKMAKHTYFLRDCANGFGWVFHRLCKNLRPLSVLYELYAVLITRQYYSFRTIRFSPFGVPLVSTWTTYFHKIFAMRTVFKAF